MKEETVEAMKDLMEALSNYFAALKTTDVNDKVLSAIAKLNYQLTNERTN